MCKFSEGASTEKNHTQEKTCFYLDEGLKKPFPGLYFITVHVSKRHVGEYFLWTFYTFSTINSKINTDYTELVILHIFREFIYCSVSVYESV